MRDVKNAEPPASLSPGAHALLPVPITNVGASLVWGQHPQALAGVGRNLHSPSTMACIGILGGRKKDELEFPKMFVFFGCYLIHGRWCCVLASSLGLRG